MKAPDTILPSVSSYEEYEELKKDTKLFENAAREIISRHHLPNEPLTPLIGTNTVFAYGSSRVIKIFPPEHQCQYISETLVMQHVCNKLSVKTPAVEYQGEIAGWPYIIMSRVDGIILEGLWDTLDQQNKVVIIRELGALIREVHALPTQGLEEIDSHWQAFIDKQIAHCVSRHQQMNLSTSLINEIPEYLDSALEYLPKIKNPVILTGEYTPMNFLVKQKAGIWHIYGLIDFGDSMLGLPQYDLLGPGAFLIQGDKTLLREFLSAYGYSATDMNSALSQQLTALMLLHQHSNLNMQVRIDNWKDRVSTLKDLEYLVWGF